MRRGVFTVRYGQGPLNKTDQVLSLKCQCCITLLNLQKSSDYIEHKPMRCHVYRALDSVLGSLVDVISLAYLITATDFFFPLQILQVY